MRNLRLRSLESEFKSLLEDRDPGAGCHVEEGSSMEAILTLGLRILHNEDYPMPGGRFSIVPRLFLPDAHGTTTLSHHEDRLQTLPNVLWGA